MRFVFAVALVFLVAGQVRARKVWKPNTNYENGANWDAGRAPCYKDSIQIPENSNTVFIQTNTTISTLTLPMNGEVLLGNNMVLSFASKESFSDEKQTCTKGQSIEYIRTKPASWFDPNNWCVSDGTKCDSQPDDIGLLETEKVPCMEEEVVFPENGTFWVDLHSGLDIFVGKIIFGGKEYTSTSLFKSFLDSKSGQKQFVTVSSGQTMSKVNIRDQVCSDKTGCACGNDQGEILKKVCSTQNCPAVNCSNAFKPKGGCCFMCGALLDMDYGTALDITRLKNVISDLYLKGQTGIKVFVSKLTTGIIQAVFSDNSDGSDAIRIATDFFNQVNQDIKGDDKHKFGITSISIESSGESGILTNPTGSASKHIGKSLEMSSGGIAGVTIACVALVIILLVCVAVFVWRKRTPNSKQLKIFSRKEHNGDLECSIDTVKYDEPPPTFDVTETNGIYVINGDGQNRGFDNPLYQSNPNLKEMGPDHFELSSSKEEQPVGHFINPLYSEEGIEEDSQI